MHRLLLFGCSQNDGLLAILLKVHVLEEGSDLARLDNAVGLTLGLLDVDDTARGARLPALLQACSDGSVLIRTCLLLSQQVSIFICTNVVPTLGILHSIILVSKETDDVLRFRLHF